MLSILRASTKSAAKRSNLVYLNPIATSSRFFSEKKTSETESTESESNPEQTTQTTQPQSKPFDIFKFIKTEVGHINEVMQKVNRPHLPKRRLLDPKAVPSPQADYVEIRYEFDKDGNASRITPEFSEEAQTEEYNENKEEEVEEEDATPKPSALILNTDNVTVWGQRMDSFKDSLRNSSLLKPIVRFSATLEKSEDPLAKMVNEARWDAKDKIEDFREKYETDQVGTLASIRRLNDKITSGSNASQNALEKLALIDPYFQLADFEEDMVTYQIPVTIAAFLEGRKDVCISSFGDPARETVIAIISKYHASNKFPDPTILDIKIQPIDVDSISVDNHIPVIQFSAIIQLVDCVRDKDGKVVEGRPSSVTPYYFAFKVTRELHNPDFDWRIVEMQYQKMFGIAG